MAWMRAVTGRMKSNYMYSVGVVYNTFPLRPGFAEADTSALEPLAQAVLDARAAHEGATLADLHDAGLMPPKRPKGASGTGSWSRSPLPAGSASRRSENASGTCSSCTSVCKHRWLSKRLRSPDGGGGAYNERRAVVGVRRDTR